MDKYTRDTYASLGGNAVAPSSPEADRVYREFDNFVEAEHAQMAVATGIMRRVEDLAERILGFEPTVTEKVSPVAQPRAGLFGGMLDAKELRDDVYARISNALARIEKVL